MRASARLEVLARQKDGRAEEREPPRRSLVSAVVSDESEGRRKKKKKTQKQKHADCLTVTQHQTHSRLLFGSACCCSHTGWRSLSPTVRRT